VPISAPARELDLTLSDAPPQGGTFRVEFVDAVGQTVWNQYAASGAVGAEIRIQRKFGPGAYFVHLYGASGQLLPIWVPRYARSWRQGQTFGAERFEKVLADERPAARRSQAQ
jgi:hypothetical protein